MSLFKKILVPVDGSRYSVDAVRMAAKLARIHGSRIKIIHVVDILVLNQLMRISEKSREAVLNELRESAGGFLKDMERELLDEQVDLEISVQEGIPHEAVLEETVAWGADLVVMGKLGRRGVSHVLIGSVTERVIEFSEAPVLVVK